ncbi:DUF6415 family natural product biosynthesis protein [Streptomyces sp. NBC_00872]|uniref:DUF6415 family natural product biosynthesis protein n=1 Tax=Streptomyces sp. NBC_00872 TaxID=2903686 RepID=UPI0038706FC4|nr:DUF6415 family natural product biosynthesis protein [Streptomyces sp. NBC_00872]
MHEATARPTDPEGDSRPLDFPTMVKTARQVVDSDARMPDEDLERATHLMRGYLALLIPEAETRLGRLTPAGIEEARRRLDSSPALLGPARHTLRLARSVITLCSHLGHGRQPTDAEPWTPPAGTTIEMVSVGRYWDAVRVRSYIGERVIERLGADSGAVIEDWHGQVLYWLIPLGAADTWNLPLSAVVPLSVATFLSVPPVSYTGEEKRLRWIVPLTTTCYLTDPELLHDVLTAEILAAASSTP